MSKIKKINLLFCLIFSFIFLFGSVFSVQAGIVKESQLIEQCIYPNERVECVVDYRTQNIRNNGEKKIIWAIDKSEFRIAKKPWYRWDSLYRFADAYAEIGKNRDYALIRVSVYRKSGIFLQEKRFDLTFELKLN